MDTQVNGKAKGQSAAHDPIQARLIGQMKAARARATQLEQKLVSEGKARSQKWVSTVVRSRSVRRWSRQLGATQQWVIEALGFASKAELKKLVKAVEALRPADRKSSH